MTGCPRIFTTSIETIRVLYKIVHFNLALVFIWTPHASMVHIMGEVGSFRHVLFKTPDEDGVNRIGCLK